jgi:intracellular septation protein
VISIRLPNVADALQRRLVANMAAERIARIGGIHDHPSAAQSLDRLAHEAPLRRHRMQLQIDAHEVGYDTRMNQLLEWLPLLVFFVGFKLLGIYWATAALMVACALQLVVHRLRTGQFKTMHIATTVVVLVLGSATLLLHDRRFIQWKPTVLLALAAAVFLGSMAIGKQPLARRMLEAVFNEPLQISARAWLLINSLWVGWLALLAAANIYVAQNFAESVWVNFKVFGITVAMLIFMLPQVLWLSGKTKAAQSDPG